MELLGLLVSPFLVLRRPGYVLKLESNMVDGKKGKRRGGLTKDGHILDGSDWRWWQLATPEEAMTQATENEKATRHC